MLTSGNACFSSANSRPVTRIKPSGLLQPFQGIAGFLVHRAMMRDRAIVIRCERQEKHAITELY